MALVPTSGLLVWAQQPQTLGGIEYGMADWPESGFGNHRAIVDVPAAEVVRARIPWRRHDANFRGKAVLIHELATGSKMSNVFACNLTREYGDVVFQPQAGPGRFAIYYMPYQQPGNTSGGWNGSYLPVRVTAESTWLTKHDLDIAAVESTIRFVGSSKEDDSGAVGSSFEIISGSTVDFADNDYTMTYEVHFLNHRGNFVVPALLLQPDNRGYQAVVYDLNGQLVMSISRKDSKEPQIVTKRQYEACELLHHPALKWTTITLRPNECAPRKRHVGCPVRLLPCLDCPRHTRSSRMAPHPARWPADHHVLCNASQDISLETMA